MRNFLNSDFCPTLIRTHIFSWFSYNDKTLCDFHLSVRLRISRCGRCTPRVKRTFRASTSPITQCSCQCSCSHQEYQDHYFLSHTKWVFSLHSHPTKYRVCRKTEKVFSWKTYSNNPCFIYNFEKSMFYSVEQNRTLLNVLSCGNTEGIMCLPLPLTMPMPSSSLAPSMLAPLALRLLLRWFHQAVWLHLGFPVHQLHPGVSIPSSTSGLWALDSTSCCRHVGSTLTPRSLGSIMASHSSSFAGLPHPFQLHLSQSSPWLRHGHPVLWLRLWSLHPFGSTGLFLPSGSTVVLAHSGSASVCQVPISSLAPWASHSAPGSLSPQIRLGLYHPCLHLSRLGYCPWLLPPLVLPCACVLMALFGVTPWLLPLSCPPCQLDVLLFSPLPPSSLRLAFVCWFFVSCSVSGVSICYPGYSLFG